MPAFRRFLLPAALALSLAACADYAAPSQALWPDAGLPFGRAAAEATQGPPVRLFQAADAGGRLATFLANSTGRAQSVTYALGGGQATLVLQPGEIREVGTGGGTIVAVSPVDAPAGGGQ
ncbi:MAG: hypothetical protein RLO50_16445 [Azospirillaceae bacterium]